MAPEGDGKASNLIDVVGLKKYFPIRGGLLKRAIGSVKAVDDITFYIKHGETLGLVGESGCGKTTVGRSIMMLTPPTAGYVFFETPKDIVRAFEVLYNLRAAIEPGKMTKLEAQMIAQAVTALFDIEECDIANEKKKHMCVEAEKLRKTVDKYQDITMHVKEEDDIRDFVEEGLSHIAKKYCINHKRKRVVRRLRSRMQFVFQDPFSSLDPKMLVKDIVAEPITSQNKYRPRRLKSAKIKEQIGELESNPLTVTTDGNSKKLRVLRDELEDTLDDERLTRNQKRLGREEIRDQTIMLLEKVGLNVEHMYRFPHEFSGGQRQRIGVARALSVNPDFVVLDEPTSALDVSVQAQILNQLNALQHDFGLTYLFISHDLSVVRYMCDRVAVMYLGKIAEYASKDALFTNPTHPYTEALLSVIPVPDPDLKRDRIILPGDVPSPANPPPGCRFHTRCPLVIDICHIVDPPLTDRGNEHFVACHVR
jgi:oligopeptide/dipeptide ABC transporter ATP-binding protein